MKNSGSRNTPRHARFATVRRSWKTDDLRASGCGVASAASHLVAPLLFGIDGVFTGDVMAFGKVCTGDLKEHVVERRRAQGERANRGPTALECHGDVGDHSCAVRSGDGQFVVVHVEIGDAGRCCEVDVTPLRCHRRLRRQ